MSTENRQFLTFKLPISPEKKLPAVTMDVARERTERHMAMLDYKPIREVLALAWAQGVIDAAHSAKLLPKQDEKL